MGDVVLPPLEIRKERDQTAKSESKGVKDLFKLDKDDLFLYDIKDMKMSSSREVRHNPNLAASNAPPSKKTKVTFSK